MGKTLEKQAYFDRKISRSLSGIFPVRLDLTGAGSREGGSPGPWTPDLGSKIGPWVLNCLTLQLAVVATTHAQPVVATIHLTVSVIGLPVTRQPDPGSRYPVSRVPRRVPGSC